MSIKKEKIQKWLDIAKNKNSLLVAGLDPASADLERGEKGLPISTSGNSQRDFRDFCSEYTKGVKPYAAGVKFNTKYFVPMYKMNALAAQRKYLQKTFFTIADCKVADLDSSNEAEMYEWAKWGVDAITAAPYASNLQGTVQIANKHGIGVISMCLMSAPTYATTKNSLVRIDQDPAMMKFIDIDDVWTITHEDMHDYTYVQKYIYDAACINIYNALGAVIGAPSDKNGLTMEEINKALYYLRKDNNEVLILIPGWGAQGGGIKFVQEIGEYAMINQSRGLMFPQGSNSTSQQQGQKAKEFCHLINEAVGADLLE